MASDGLAVSPDSRKELCYRPSFRGAADQEYPRPVFNQCALW